MKYLLIPLFLIVFATTAFAASLDAVISPTTAAPGSDLKLTIKTADVPNSKWFVAFDVTLEGGCVRTENSQATISDFMLDEVSADQTKEYNIKAPLTEGSCTCDIEYQFTDASKETMQLTAEIKEPVTQAQTQPEITPPAELEPANYKGWTIAGAVVVICLIIFFSPKHKTKKVKAK